jgi:hypothetical protein
MSPRRRKEAAKQAVLGELELLARDRHPRNQTLIARFARCTDYQGSTGLLTEAPGSTGTLAERVEGAILIVNMPARHGLKENKPHIYQ